ncbi:synaptic vesicle glycoprotein 2B-like [Galleria mellonella]|uniref:Synaptic vesicle glycoprotein 2B-like n=1 Tax=Galleria mellonella TaxID=7137 RepID=A0A6J1WL23_GALME|nr:synaptic vesicle glycoprotein 2B-like [Galleria mellonella]
MEKVNTLSQNVDVNDKHAADLDQALSVAGFGWYNVKYCLTLALFLISAIIEPVGYSYLLPAAKCDLNMSDSQRGIISSIPYLGVVLTSFPWGYLVDTRGRKKMIIYSSLGVGGFSVLSAFMPEMISFTICKTLSAICLACPAAVPYTFIGEIIPLKYRDVTLSVTNALQIMGSGLVPLLAWGILPLDFRVDFGAYEFRSWRLLCIAYACFFFLSTFLLSFGPESPKYLVSQGKHDEALKVLQIMYAENKGKSPDTYPVKRLNMPTVNKEKTSFLNSLKVQTLPLLKPPYFKWLVLNGFLLFGIMASLNGLYMWVPDVLNRVFSGSGGNQLTACGVIAQRVEAATDDTVCDDTIEPITFIINSISSTSCALIAVFVSVLVKFIGKKTLLIAVYFIIGTFCILINFVTEQFVFATLLSSLTLTGLGLGPVNAFTVQIFPTHLRGMAVSLTMMLGRSGSVIGTNVAGLMINAACEATFYSFGGLLILCGLLAFILPRAQPPAISKKTYSVRL